MFIYQTKYIFIYRRHDGLLFDLFTIKSQLLNCVYSIQTQSYIPNYLNQTNIPRGKLIFEKHKIFI